MASADDIEREIAALKDDAIGTLKERSAKLYGSAPPKRMGKSLLALAVAYEMQRRAFGVRTDRLAARVRSVKSQSGQKQKSKDGANRTLKAGGRLVREWRGKSYEVYVADDDCYLDGKRYKSLSAAAFAITGSKWNGPMFFGLRKSSGLRS